MKLLRNDGTHALGHLRTKADAIVDSTPATRDTNRYVNVKITEH